MEFDLWPQIQDCLCAADPDAAALADLSWVPIIIDVKKKAPHKHLHYQCRRVFKAKVTLVYCRTFSSYLRFVFNNMKKERMCKHWLNSSCVFRVCVCPLKCKCVRLTQSSVCVHCVGCVTFLSLMFSKGRCLFKATSALQPPERTGTRTHTHAHRDTLVLTGPASLKSMA